MLKHNQDGAVSGTLISLIICVVLLIGTLSFALWASASRQDYKNNSDQKAAAAAEAASQATAAQKDKEFVEKEKNPLRTYNGPAAYGSLVVKYPKTWSGYVAESSGGSGALVDGYFYPNVVPSISDDNSVFALRLQVLNQAYADVVKGFTSRGNDTPPKVSAYALPQVPNVIGVRVTGQLTEKQTGDMVVLPLRSQTLEVSTQGTQFENDFNNYIIPNLSFSP